MVAFLEQVTEDLPESIERSLPVAFQREGARKVIDEIIGWEPSSIRNSEDREGLDED